MSQPAATASLIVRGRAEQFADVLREEVRRLDPDLPLFNLQSPERVSYITRWVPRIMSTVFSIIAIIAIVLSAVGLYSLTAYAAAQRTYEVGVRMALGARRSQVLWLFLKQTLARLDWARHWPSGGSGSRGRAARSAGRSASQIILSRSPALPCFSSPCRSLRRYCRRAARRESIRW